MNSYEEALDYIQATFPDLEHAEGYGYEMYFFGPDRVLPVVTLISSDTEYDAWSNLNRPGVCRLNIGVGLPAFREIFGKGEINIEGYDLTALNTILPHPDYYRQGYVCVLSPVEQQAEKVKGLLKVAYQQAAVRADGPGKTA